MRAMRFVFPVVLVVAFVAAGYYAGPQLLGPCAHAQEQAEVNGAREELAQLAQRDELSRLFRAVSKVIKPAVVEIRVEKKVAARSSPFPDLEDFFGREIPFPTPDREEQREFFSQGLGSGVIVDAEQGYVLTNYHVVSGADQIEIILADERRFETEWVRGDPQTDLAVLKLKDPERLIDAPLGNSDEMEVGDWVLAVGAPEGLSQTVTAGIVSAKGRVTGATGYENYIQTDASINRGNSGGPLVNMRAEVIGINTLILSRTGGNEGIGMAIPSNMAQRIMRQLIDEGKVVRGYLGVGIQDVDQRLARSLNLPSTRGSLVRQVLEDTPAAEAGLKVGDFIVAVNGRSVASSNELRNLIAGVRPGEAVELTVVRNGEKEALKVTVAEQPTEMSGTTEPAEPEEGDAQGESLARYGLTVATPTRQLARQYGYPRTPKGVFITDVAAASDASKQGLRPGMLIVQAQGRDVRSAEQLAKVAAEEDAQAGLRLLVSDPQDAQRFVFITPEK